MMRATWKPYEKHGTLTRRSGLPDYVFAYPEERKEPLTDESHVRNAIARFDQATGVTDEERDLAWANIKKAATYFGVHISESDWRELGKRPSTGRTASDRKKSARKAAATRKRKATTGRKSTGGATAKKSSTRKKKRSG